MKASQINKIIFLLFIFLFETVFGQSVDSGVYKWIDAASENKIDMQKMVSGETIDLKNMSIFSITMDIDDKFEKTLGVNEEILIIIKDGEFNIEVNDIEKTVGKGSVAVILPNDKFTIHNSADSKSQLYYFIYNSKDPVNLDRGLAEGGSFIVDWNELEFKPHDRGGIREYFEKATAMFHRFEMHVTTLNPGINSHNPHTHTSDEMVLMIDGEAVLQIGNEHFNAETGDLIFLGANKPHALNNESGKKIMYFAFHGE